MTRTTIAASTVLVFLNCLVAVLPAQDSSRRTSPKYRAPGASQRPSLAPASMSDANLPPIVPPPSRADSFSGTNEALRGQFTDDAAIQQPYAAPGTLATEGASEAPQLPADVPPGDLDDRLQSVLKRNRMPAMVEAPAAREPAANVPSNELPRRQVSSPPAMLPSATTGRPIANSTPSGQRSIQNASVTGKNAALKVEAIGPQAVTVGKPATYVIHVTNESESTAEEVQLRIAAPAWVVVQGMQPTSGEVAPGGESSGATRLVWNVARIAARGKETLKLQVVTRQGDSFDLGVEWTARPAVTRAAITVMQPQLALSLAGPTDMTFGDEKTFTLSVSNPGSGDAERVMVSVAAGNSPPQQFDAGTIPAGHKKEVPLAVVASQAGAIDLQISAAGEGSLEARTAMKINVRKAEVSLAIEGPPHKYAGSEAIYLVTVTNSGTASADNIHLSLAMPAGGKFLGGIEGTTASAGGLKWKIANLPPGGERQYEVRLQLTAPGANRVAVQSQAIASGTANCAAVTEVEAVSDLKLVVNDPAGPLPTGDEAVYELQVINRGSQAARQVKIIMQFSEGVEPTSFEGCEARLVPGQVLCQPLAQLGPGEQATLRVKAKAEQAGTHHFRIEVTSTDGDARLVSEGTTRFFVESSRGSSAASTAKKPIPSPGTLLR